MTLQVNIERPSLEASCPGCDAIWPLAVAFTVLPEGEKASVATLDFLIACDKSGRPNTLIHVTCSGCGEIFLVSTVSTLDVQVRVFEVKEKVETPTEPEPPEFSFGNLDALAKHLTPEQALRVLTLARKHAGRET